VRIKSTFALGLGLSLISGCAFTAIGDLTNGGPDSGRTTDALGTTRPIDGGGRSGHDGGHSADTGAVSAVDADHRDAGSARDAPHDGGKPDSRKGEAGPRESGPPSDSATQDGRPSDDSGTHDAGHATDAGQDAGTHEAGAGEAGDASGVYPETCAEANLTGTAQVTTTLYVDARPSQPWTAVCVYASGSWKTYLPLPAGNTSSYPLGGCASADGGGGGVVTTYAMVLFDPSTLTVDTSDHAFSRSEGHTYEVSGESTVFHDYDWMPFASARSCVPNGTAATGFIVLTGTPFAVASSQPFTPEGFMPSGGASMSGASTTLSIKGEPAGISPCGANDYYTDMGGPCLKLTYAP
jgi:hypothetical protein